MKMNAAMHVGTMWLCGGAILFTIGLIGWGINCWMDKKIQMVQLTRVTFNLYGAQQITDENGESIIDMPNGTWKYTSKKV